MAYLSWLVALQWLRKREDVSDEIDEMIAERELAKHIKKVHFHLSLCVRKPTIWVLTRSDTNLAVQLLKMVRGWKFWI